MSKKEARSLFRFLKLVILTSSWTMFHCLSREAKSSDCCFDRYKSRARSFRSSCVIQCGSLPLVPEYVDSISSKDIDSAESSLEGISSSDEERRSLFTGGVGTGRSSEWGTGLIADRRFGYLIFFLEDALKPVILVKQKWRSSAWFRGSLQTIGIAKLKAKLKTKCAFENVIPIFSNSKDV